ncbi:subtilase [Thozetella sp. PMI_491]|nr:subtilase [Thozetella sp. PMI_491]
MRVSVLSTALALVGFGQALVARDEDPAATPSSAEGTAKRYIIEFAEGADYTQAVAEISARPGVKVVKVFNSTDIFSGVSVETTVENADSLNALSAASRVWPAKKIQLNPILDSSSYHDILAATNYSIHDMTGVDKLHAAGIYGKGATVAIVDTGVYYPHPDLGGGIGPGYTIAGGYDYVGDADWPNSAKQPDSDPLDYVGHGTHVAGIIAANSTWFTGVAPQATILAYKVFTTQGTTDDDTIIQAFLDAYNAGADVITASIQSTSGWTDNAWAVVADRIVDAGVVVTIAAGNQGQYGPFFASSGSSGKNVLAVASVDPTTLASLAFEATITDNDTTDTVRMAYTPPFGSFPSLINDWPIVNLGNACQPLPADTPSLANKLALITNNFCSPYIKEANVAQFGAEYVLAYTSPLPDDGFYIPEWSMPHGFIGTDQAEAFIAAMDAGASITAKFPDTLEFVGVHNSLGGIPSYYTSYGATNELTLKPDISAPGGQIFSLYLDNGYAIMSGTSMACPYVAGVAALYIGKYGGRNVHGSSFAKQLSARILSSGQSVPWGRDSSVWAPTTQIGNGVINATKVLNYDTELSFVKFELNDTHHFERYQGVDITNHGAASVVYNFEVQPAGGYEAFWPNSGDAYLAPRMKFYSEISDPLSIVPNVKLPSGKIEVKPGETKKAEFIFEIPDGLNEASLPVYSGKILVTGSNGDQLSVPYFGVGSNVKTAMQRMWYLSDNFPTMKSTTSKIPLAQKSSFSFNLSLASQDFPKLQAAVVYGTKELRWDIFEEGWKERKWTYPLVVGQNGYLGSVASFALAGQQSVFDPSTDDENNVVALPAMDIARHTVYEFWWLGRFANGSAIVPGKYNMRIAALKPFGVPDHSDNWDVWETPLIEVVA